MKYIKQGFGLTLGAYLAYITVAALDAICKKLNETTEKAEETEPEKETKE